MPGDNMPADDTPTDDAFLRRTFEVAARARAHGNHPFGAILVDASGTVLLEQENGYLPARDGTAHAERLLATRACTTLPPQVLARATSASEPGRRFDAIVLDPPRTGALEAIEGIAAHAPAVVVYVSCDPATLGRDAAKLVAAGYHAERAWPVDLMPQTSHVEVVLRLVRAAGPSAA